MTEHDRGAYTPQPDAPLQFDARGSRGGGRRPMPMTLIGSGAVLVVFVGALALHYRHDSKLGTEGAARPVGEPVGQIKAPPPATAQPKDTAAGIDVFGGTAAAAKAPTIAPPPEAPKPRLQVQTDTSVAAIKPVPTTSTPAPVATVPLKPAAPATLAQAAPAKPATPASAYHAPTLAAATPAKPDATAIVAKVAATPVAKPAPAQPVKTAAASPAAAKPATVAAAAPAAGAVVQIGAFSTPAQSEKGYADVSTAMAGAMAGKSKRVETVAVNGKTYLRTSVAGFASRAAADAFCKALAAKGHTCFAKG